MTYIYFLGHITSNCFHSLENNCIKISKIFWYSFTIQFKGCAISSSFRIQFQIHIRACNHHIQRFFNIKELIKTTKKDIFSLSLLGPPFPYCWSSFIVPTGIFMYGNLKSLVLIKAVVMTYKSFVISTEHMGQEVSLEIILVTLPEAQWMYRSRFFFVAHRVIEFGSLDSAEIFFSEL